MSHWHNEMKLNFNPDAKRIANVATFQSMLQKNNPEIKSALHYLGSNTDKSYSRKMQFAWPSTKFGRSNQLSHKRTPK